MTRETEIKTSAKQKKTMELVHLIAQHGELAVAVVFYVKSPENLGRATERIFIIL